MLLIGIFVKIFVGIGVIFGIAGGGIVVVGVYGEVKKFFGNCSLILVEVIGDYFIDGKVKIKRFIEKYSYFYFKGVKRI